MATQGVAKVGPIIIYYESVLHLIEAVEYAVSPIGLMTFMQGMVSPYFEDRVVSTFAELGGGGVPGGAWAPLEDSTLRIRHHLGYYDDMAINERSGSLMHWLMTSRAFSSDGAGGVTMQIPGNDGDAIQQRKLKTAQEGYTQSGSDMLPGAYTPPRPVLFVETEDVLAVTKLLQLWVIDSVLTGSL